MPATTHFYAYPLTPDAWPEGLPAGASVHSVAGVILEHGETGDPDPETGIAPVTKDPVISDPLVITSREPLEGQEAFRIEPADAYGIA